MKRLIVFCLFFVTSFVFAQEFAVKMNADAATLKRMSTFVSNFTEVSEVEPSAISKNPTLEEYIQFAVWHFIINVKASRLHKTKPILSDGKRYPTVGVSAEDVISIIKRYFDVDLSKEIQALKPRPYNWENASPAYDGNYFITTHGHSPDEPPESECHCGGSAGPATVTAAYVYKDEIMMLGTCGEIKVYARAKNHVWKGKPTWALLEMTVNKLPQVPYVLKDEK